MEAGYFRIHLWHPIKSLQIKLDFNCFLFSRRNKAFGVIRKIPDIVS
jgi:hypothetical protein